MPVSTAASNVKTPPPSTGATPTGGTPPAPPQGESTQTAEVDNKSPQGSEEAPEAAISVANGVNDSDGAKGEKTCED